MVGDALMIHWALPDWESYLSDELRKSPMPKGDRAEAVKSAAHIIHHTLMEYFGCFASHEGSPNQKIAVTLLVATVLAAVFTEHGNLVEELAEDAVATKRGQSSGRA